MEDTSLWEGARSGVTTYSCTLHSSWSICHRDYEVTVVSWYRVQSLKGPAQNSLLPSSPWWEWSTSDPPGYSQSSLLGRDGHSWQGLSAKGPRTNPNVARLFFRTLCKQQGEGRGQSGRSSAESSQKSAAGLL